MDFIIMFCLYHRFEILNPVILEYKNIFKCNWWEKKNKNHKKEPYLSLLTLLTMQKPIDLNYWVIGIGRNLCYRSSLLCTHGP